MSLLPAVLVALLAAYAGFLAGLVLAGRRGQAVALARLAPDALVLVRRLASDGRVPRRQRLLLAGVGAYLAFPFDLVPDFIPVAGQLDDVIVVGLALRAVVRAAGPEVVADRWPGPEHGLELVRRLAGIAEDSRPPAQLAADALRASLVVGALALLLTGAGHDAASMGVVAVAALALRAARPAPALDLAFMVFLAADSWLTVLGAFDTFNHDDRIGHLLLPALVTPMLMEGARRAGVLADPPRSRVALAITGAALGLALGAAYELVEWTADSTLGTNMSLGYADTLGDLACDAAGATVGATLAAVLGRPRG